MRAMHTSHSAVLLASESRPGDPGEREKVQKDQREIRQERRKPGLGVQRQLSAEVLILDCATPPRGVDCQSALGLPCPHSLDNFPSSVRHRDGHYGGNMDEWDGFSGLKKVIQMKRTGSALTKTTSGPLYINHPSPSVLEIQLLVWAGIKDRTSQLCLKLEAIASATRCGQFLKNVLKGNERALFNLLSFQLAGMST